MLQLLALADGDVADVDSESVVQRVDSDVEPTVAGFVEYLEAMPLRLSQSRLQVDRQGRANEILADPKAKARFAELGAILARVTRSAVLDVLREDFVRTARAKGLSRRAVLWGHVLRNAMVPVLTVMGLQFANLVTGTVVVENVFVLPGIGRLVFQAINNRDLIVVRDVVMLLAATVVAVSFVVDVLYALIDPRLRTAAA